MSRLLATKGRGPRQALKATLFEEANAYACDPLWPIPDIPVVPVAASELLPAATSCRITDAQDQLPGRLD